VAEEGEGVSEADFIIGKPRVFAIGDALPGEQWEPSNGTDGGCFIDEWCSRCSRDKPMSEGKDFDDCGPEELCEELAASFRGEAKHWRTLPDGEAVCLLFHPVGQPIIERCPNTKDMFE
jgi:hypothetical protein